MNRQTQEKLPPEDESKPQLTNAAKKYFKEDERLFRFGTVLRTLAETVDKLDAVPTFLELADSWLECLKRYGLSVTPADHTNCHKSMLAALEDYEPMRIQMGYVRSTSNFLCYLSELLAEIFSTRPETLNYYNDKQMTVAEFLKLSGEDSLRRYLAEQIVQEASYKGVHSIAGIFNNKLYMLIDCMVLILVGFIQFIPSMLCSGTNLSHWGKPLLEVFFIFLVFASLRILRRHELWLLFSVKTVLSPRRRILCFPAVIILLWYSAWALPGPCIMPDCSSIRSRLQNLGMAMEIYATDNNKLYPSTLEGLIPNYLHRLPDTGCYYHDSRTEKYYTDKRGFPRSYGYEVDNMVPSYSITCSYPLRSDSHKSVTYIYSGKEGLMDNLGTGGGELRNR